MQAPRPFLIAIAAFGSVCAALPAFAQTIEQLMTPGDTTQLVDAFKAICVDPGADAKAQAAVASGAPWNLVYQGKGRKLGAVYSAFPLQVTIDQKGGVSTCDVTSMLPDETKAGEVAQLVETRLGVTDGQVDEAKQTVRWAKLAADGRAGLFGLQKGGMGKIGVIVAYTGERQ